MINSFIQEGLKLDWTVSIGAIVQILTFIVTVIGLYIKLNERIVKIEGQVSAVTDLGNKLDRLAKLETEVSMLYDWWKNKIERRYDTRPS